MVEKKYTKTIAVISIHASSKSQHKRLKLIRSILNNVRKDVTDTNLDTYTYNICGKINVNNIIIGGDFNISDAEFTYSPLFTNKNQIIFDNIKHKYILSSFKQSITRQNIT